MTAPDLAALDRAVEEQRDAFKARVGLDIVGGWTESDECQLRILESRITARAVAQEQARRAKLVAALERQRAFCVEMMESAPGMLTTGAAVACANIDAAFAADRETLR